MQFSAGIHLVLISGWVCQLLQRDLVVHFRGAGFCTPLPISVDLKDRQVFTDLLPAFLMLGRNFIVCRVKFQKTAALSLLLREGRRSSSCF